MQISEWRVFQLLDTLKLTATGLENIPAWFLRIGAPFFAAPLADMMNPSLSTSVVPQQWKSASILPIPKVVNPHAPSDFRPISMTPVLSRLLHLTPPLLSYGNQFAFQPSGSTVAAPILLLHTNLLETHQYVIVYVLDF
jgi:hypothetical protein